MLGLHPPLCRSWVFIIFVACVMSVNAVLKIVDAAANLPGLALVASFLSPFIYIIAVLPVLPVLVPNRLRA
jgi:uncharacterized membrane protein YhaH (DUF805 family)